MMRRRPLNPGCRWNYATCGTCSFKCLCRKACTRYCYCLAPAVGHVEPTQPEPGSDPHSVWWDRRVNGGGRR